MYAYKYKSDNKDKTVQRSVTPYESRAKRTGIPVQMLQNAEKQSGLSFDDVRVHYNSPKPAQLQALAYTQGEDVHIAPGQEQHLGHELGHVVQQKQGRVQPTVQFSGVNANNDVGLENEADEFGQVLQGVFEGDVVQMCGGVVCGDPTCTGCSDKKRYPTFSGSMKRPMSSVAKPRCIPQGPHTVAHSSVSELVRGAPPDFDFKRMILSEDEADAMVRRRLKVGPDSPLPPKAERALGEYNEKCTVFLSKLSGGTATFGDKMEIISGRPDATGHWADNCKTGAVYKTTPKAKAAGKGERRGFFCVDEQSEDDETRYNYVKILLEMHPDSEKSKKILESAKKGEKAIPFS
jgi:hypothetical protein